MNRGNYPSDRLRILFFGDLIGDPGLAALTAGIDELKEETDAQIIVANGENMADSSDLASIYTEKLYAPGVDVITSGNHIWHKKDAYPLLESDERILRPANYPSTVPGRGSVLIRVNNTAVGVINVIGQIRMSMNADCPFNAAMRIARGYGCYYRCRDVRSIR